jgi:undecaprenyl diphosphate synthase
MAVKQQALSDTVKEIINQNKIKHVAIIMDGNRRWALKNNLPKTAGHNSGRKTFKNIVKHSARVGLQCLTTYAFSTENWGRDKKEVNFLMNLLVESLNNEIKELIENNVKLKFIGRKDRLSEKIVNMMHHSEKITVNNTGLLLQVAIDYGARFEIAEAVRKIAEKVKANELAVSDIDEELLETYLYTASVPDPDLIIRTGGEHRLSNYLLWQAAYSELYITPTFWPEFTEEEFNHAIIDFSKRQRRWGKD